MNPAVSNEPRAWTPRRWWTVAILVFLVHVELVVVFGAKKSAPVRPVVGVPFLALANPSDEMIALNDPTLFALPHDNDFILGNTTARSFIQQPSFPWTEPPKWLDLAPEHLGKAFGRFMQTNQFSGGKLDFKPAPKFSEPPMPPFPTLAQQSSVRLRGELAARPLLKPLVLTNWPDVDVIAPSKVQVLVDDWGRVISAILLPPDAGLEEEKSNAKADQKALQLARAARFAPAPRQTVGQMIFNWHAVPMPATNSPANLP